MSSNGSANVKHSEAVSDEIVTAMSTACGASIFLFELFKKNLEIICFPSYEMNAGVFDLDGNYCYYNIASSKTYPIRISYPLVPHIRSSERTLIKGSHPLPRKRVGSEVSQNYT